VFEWGGVGHRETYASCEWEIPTNDRLIR
jgi:hypothetical protein